MMKKILIIAYYYSPINNAGTQRIESWVKYLRSFGFEPLVLTSKLFFYKDFYDSKNVYRAFDLQKVFSRSKNQTTGFSQETKSIFKKLVKRYLFFPDTKVLWLPFAVIKAARLINKFKLEYFLTTFPPASSLAAGLILKYLTNKFWVVDFRDAWVHDPLDLDLLKPSLKKDLSKILEKLVVKKADLVLTTSGDSLKYYRKLAGQDANKVKLLTNGYSQADFDLAKRNLNKFKQGLDFKPEDYFVISHIGALANSHPANTPTFFWQAVKFLVSRRRELETKLKIVFAGNLTTSEINLPKELGLESLAVIKSQVPHIEAIAWREIANLLLVIDAPKPKGQRSSYVHGKIFEHFASGKPILTLVPNGSCRDFIKI